VGERKGYIARTVLTVVAVCNLLGDDMIFSFFLWKEKCGGELGEDDDRGRSKADDTRRQKKAEEA